MFLVRNQPSDAVIARQNDIEVLLTLSTTAINLKHSEAAPLALDEVRAALYAVAKKIKEREVG